MYCNVENYVLWCSRMIKYNNGNQVYVCWTKWGRTEVKKNRYLNVAYWTEDKSKDPTIREIIDVNNFVWVRGGWKVPISKIKRNNKLLEALLS